MRDLLAERSLCFFGGHNVEFAQLVFFSNEPFHFLNDLLLLVFLFAERASLGLRRPRRGRSASSDRRRHRNGFREIV